MDFSFDKYKTDGFFDEMFAENGKLRDGYLVFKTETEKLTHEDMLARQHAAERSLMAMGITFNV